MMPLIKRRTDQIVHACINNAEGFCCAFFLIEAAGQQHAGIANNIAARLEQDLQPAFFQHRHHTLSVLLDGQRLVLLFLGSPPFWFARLERGIINNAHPSTDGEKLNAVSRLQTNRKRGDFFHRLKKRLQGSQLRANVHLQAAQLDIRKLSCTLVGRIDDFEIDPKLVFGFTGRDILVGLGIDIRVHPKRDRCHLAHFPSHLINKDHLLLALGIKTVDALVDGIFDLFTGLANTSKGALTRIPTSLDHPAQLASGYNIKTTALIHQQLQHRQVRVRLDRIFDTVVEPRQCLVEPTVVVTDRRRAINISGGTMLISQASQINILAMKRTILIMKRVHALLCTRDVEYASEMRVKRVDD